MIFLRRSEPVDPKKELASFQGTWTFDNVMTDRTWPKPIGKGSDKNGKNSERKWVVKGNEITWTSLDGSEVKASFTIDPNKVPSQIDFTFLSGPNKGRDVQGGVRMGGRRELWLCLVDPGSDGRSAEVSFLMQRMRVVR